MKLRTVLLTASIAVITALFTAVAVLNALLPGKIRALAIQTLQKQTGKQAAIGSVSISLLKGLVFKDVRLSENGETLFSVKRAAVGFNVFTLAMGKLGVSSLEFDSPYAFIERGEDGVLNFKKLFHKKAGGSPSVVSRIIVRDGRISFRDLRITPAFSKTIEHIELSTGFALPADIGFRLSASLRGSSSRVQINGKYRLPEKSLSATVVLKEFQAQDVQPYIWRSRIAQAVVNGTNYVQLTGDVLSIKTNSEVRGAWFGIGRTKAIADGSIEAAFTFDLKKGLEDYAGTVVFSDCELQTAQPLRLQGPVEFSKDKFSWKALKLGYAGEEYISSGTLSDISHPSLELGIYSRNMHLEATAKSKDNVLNISRLKAEFRDSTLFLQGSVDLSRLPALPAQLYSTAHLELADLGLFFAKTKTWNKAAPRGKLNLDLDAFGDLRDFTKLTVNALAKSTRLSAYGVTAGNFSLDYKQAAGIAKTLFNFSFYDGTVNGDASGDLTKPGLPLSGEFSADGIALEKFKADTPLKDRDLAGNMTSNAVFSGELAHPRSYAGSGTVAISKGRLWQLDILKDLGQNFFPELLSVTFEKGSSNFRFKEQTVYVENLNLMSSLIQLAGKGSLRLDGPVDAFINIQVSENVLPNLWQLKKFAAAILRQTGKIVGVRVTGTRKQPQYQLQQPIFSGVFQGLRDFFNPKK
jgi:hypothetical protein